MGQRNIIELNGKTYDADTGALLSESRIKATPAKMHATHSASGRPAHHRGRVIDGFIRQHHVAHTPRASDAPKPAAHHIPAQPTAATVQNQPAAMPHKPKHMDMQRAPHRAAAHHPQKAHTLMRHIVKRPHAQLKPAIRTMGPSEMMARPASELTVPLEKKLSVTQINPFRLGRAKQVTKSQHIRRYSPAAALHQPRIAQSLQPLQQTAHPALAAQQWQPQAPVPIEHHQAAPATDMFAAALASATSHEQPHVEPKKHRSRAHRRAVNVLAGIGAFLVLGGFVAYLNMPAIEMQVASIHAGFHAQMPGYKPSGYALTGGVKTARGTVTMTFRSGDQHFTLKQQSSNWDSQTLLDQNAETSGTPEQTIQSQGRTIFLYGNNHAVWVDGNVRYDLTGNAELSNNQLSAIAASI